MQNKNGDEFLGTGWSFPPAFMVENAAATMVPHAEDIRQSLMILFSTSPGERVMHPHFGCNLKKQVFENINQGAVTKIKDAVRRAILFFEPRIELLRVSVTVDEDPQNTHSIYNGYVVIEVDYRIRQTNTRSNLVYPFYFAEASHV